MDQLYSLAAKNAAEVIVNSVYLEITHWKSEVMHLLRKGKGNGTTKFVGELAAGWSLSDLFTMCWQLCAPRLNT